MNVTRAKGERTEEEWKQVKRIDYSPLLRSYIASPPNSVTFSPRKLFCKGWGMNSPCEPIPQNSS